MLRLESSQLDDAGEMVAFVVFELMRSKGLSFAIVLFLIGLERDSEGIWISHFFRYVF